MRRSVLDLHFQVPTAKPILAIEVDCENVPLTFENGLWEGLMWQLTSQWVQAQSYAGTGTILSISWTSVNFHHHGQSEFYVIFGMSQAYKKFLREQLPHHLGKSVRTESESVVPRLQDGWGKRCHIEGGIVWQPEDANTWVAVSATTGPGISL